MKNQIKNTLLKMGTPPTLKGFDYIISIIMLLDKPEWKYPKWSALYYCVANIHGVSSCSVEKNIRTALQLTRDKCHDFNSIEKYIGFDGSNSDSLLRLYMILKDEQEDDPVKAMLEYIRGVI